LLPLPLSAAWVGAYLATLPKQAKVRTIEGSDSLPRWIALLYGLGSAIFGLLSYGVNSVAAFASDLGAIGAAFCMLILPIAMGYGQGAGRSFGHKLGYAALSGWFGFLQLTLPLLLATYASALTLLGVLVLPIACAFIAYRAHCRWPSPFVLLATWVMAGAGCIALTLAAAKLQPVDGASFGVAFCAGGAFACIWFGFYLAVALGFNAHNNEAGGAARVDFYRHFIRFKLEPDRLTGYVIGFDRPALNPTQKLQVKLVDRFELRPGSKID
jgi:hypothetical protein